MIWRLESMTKQGVEGTVLGTLCMPYLSGLGNLIFVFVILRNGGSGGEVILNCLVNNTTNVTLLLGLPAIMWGLSVIPTTKAKKRPKKKEKQAASMHRLSLMLTITAMIFFSAVLWALGRDGTLNRGDGVTLIGIFLFWQGFHVYEVLKENIRQPKPYGAGLLLDGVLLLICGLVIYVSIEWLVQWLVQIETGFISKEQLGLLSGWLMVLPNAILAFYYAAKRRADVVYSSQLGDGHICIPLCIGLFAAIKPIAIVGPFDLGLTLIAGASFLHLGLLLIFGRLPRWIGFLLTAAYGVFMYLGFL